MDTEAVTATTSVSNAAWESITPPVSQQIFGVNYGNSLFIAVGKGGTILTSVDATTWTPQVSPVSHDLYGACWSKHNSLFVISGDNGSILTSPEGVTWTQQTTGAEGYPLNGIVWSEEKKLFVVAGGTSRLLTSTDALSWTLYDIGSGSHKSVCWSSHLGLFVCVGDIGNIFTSSDGTTWTRQTSNVSVRLSSVAENGHGFVAVGREGTIVSSPDGTTWTTEVSGTQEHLYGISYAWGQFIAVGGSATVIASSDGSSWLSQTLPGGTTADVFCVAFGQLQFVSGGSAGDIFTSLKDSFKIGSATEAEPSGSVPNTYYTHNHYKVELPQQSFNGGNLQIILSGDAAGTASTAIDDELKLVVNGGSSPVFENDYSHGNQGRITSLEPTEITTNFAGDMEAPFNLSVQYVDLYHNWHGGNEVWLNFSYTIE